MFPIFNNIKNHCGSIYQSFLEWLIKLIKNLFKPHCGNPPFNFWKWLIELLFGKHNFKKNSKLKVAFIGNYKADCGVSTYNYELLKYLKDNIEIKIFAEHNNDLSTDFVSYCWNREDNLKKELIKQVKEFNPDIVHISHEYGIFPKAFQFTSLCSIFKSLNFKVIATLHSVYEHLDKTVSETAPDLLIVHTEEAKTCLIKKGISKEKIYIIPHGTECSEHGELLPSLYNTWKNEYTIYHPGFLFKYKGHLFMLDVIKQLKHKYPNVHYIIQGSENERNKIEHDLYYEEIRTKIKKLQLEHNVTINRGFIDKRLIMNAIRTVKVVVLPYSPHPEHDVYATSGIARMVLTTETPLITSDAHIFDDIEQIVSKGHTIQDFVSKITTVFESNIERDIQNKIKVDFLKIVNWKNIALLTVKLYKDIL